MSIYPLNESKRILEKSGYSINDPWDIVDGFEKLLANFCGSKFAISLDSCTNALFLALKYKKYCSLDIEIPSRTYLSVPQTIIRSKNKPIFKDYEWSGIYQLGKTNIYDSAGRVKRDMYISNSFMCLSFHLKKNIPIGKGGMILTDDEDAYKWMYKAVYEGRERKENHNNITNLEFMGWNMYMAPEQAAYGIKLFNDYLKLEFVNDCASSAKYKDLSKFSIFDNIRNNSSFF